MRVRIAIPTFHRLDSLRDALDGVNDQIAELSPLLSDVSVMVIDNDPQGSARSATESKGALYVVEPHPGIAAVRNRSIVEAANEDAIIFLDDDEVPCRGWLRTLIERFKESGADGVAGKVLTPFPDDVPEWIAVSGAFVRPVRRDGAEMDEAATNNLMLNLHSVRRSAIRFDERFGLSGGSDSLFTRSFVRWGAKIVWAERAVVLEQVDPERFTRSWVLQRTFRLGNTSCRVNIALARTRFERRKVRAQMIVTGVIRVVVGHARIGWGRATGSLSHVGHGERTASRGRGMVAGTLGHVHSEYGLRRAEMQARAGRTKT